MIKTITIVILLITLNFAQSSWQSSIVYFDENKNLVYEKDAQGNRIPDFSYAGYRNGNFPIPEIPVVKTIQPIAGDNTLHIESALFEVAMMPKDENGFRGALLLDAGIYEIQGTINLQFDGVVIRGMGDSDDPASNTILWATGNSPSKRTVLLAGGGNNTDWKDFVSGTFKTITSDTVHVGDFSFEVNSTFLFAPGDNIIIEHPCTDAWLQAVDYGGTHSDEPGAEPDVDVPWKVNSAPIRYNRYITKIEDNRIFVDAPVFNTLVKELAQCQIYKYKRENLLTNIGIENLRIDIEAGAVPDENHAWNALDLFLVEDAWVKDCTFLHFGLSGVRTQTATRVTIENCQALDPVAVITGGNMYNFNVESSSQLILFKNCRASNGRHHYVSNGKSTTSGIVFVDCTSEGSYASSEGHRLWSQALLYDNYRELDGPRPGLNKRLLGLYNRGHYGTSHGWAAAHSVAWNCDVNNGYLIVQKPPTAQNYAIGCSGLQIRGDIPYAEFDEPSGFVEGNNQPGLEPRSLYYEQFAQRTGNVNSIENLVSKPILAKGFELFQNYPNPFNPETQVRYKLQSAGFVKLTIFDLTGREVRTLFSGNQKAGDHQIIWNGKEESGNVVASGIYIYRLEFNGFSESRRMLLLK